MKIAVPQFPGSNGDQDALWSLRTDMGWSSEYVWHAEPSFDGFDGVFIPGGFSYGDALRSGSIAARSPIMDGIREFAERGGPILAVCNGFQIACEAGLLPGALLPNESGIFHCADVTLRADGKESPWTEGIDRLLRIPVAHGEGRYACHKEALDRLEGEGRVAFRYVNAQGEAVPEANPNGSRANIAGVLNERRNVLGMMPHPERAARDLLGGADGKFILDGFARALAKIGA